MGQRAAAPHGVMESGGSYNLHSAIPAGGAGLALPLLEQAARTIALDSTDQPLVIADYGSSQGKNSLPPLRAAIRTLRGRVGPARPIIVVHVDQPANDFNTLFEVLHADPERYSLDDPNVFPSAIGRSFYENVFPKAHVHLGWSSYAAVWLSRNPARIPGHFVPRVATGTVREAFERQAAEDWKAFLSLRAVELKPGGRLVVVLPGMDDEGVSGLEPVFLHANEALAQLLIGRVGTGYLLDRLFGARVAACFFVCVAAGIGLFLVGAAPRPAFLGAILIGLGLGAEVDMIPYLVSRYFGLRSFAQIYSVVLATFILSGAVGPLLMGWSFDLTRSYRASLIAFLAATLSAALLITRLGPYRYRASDSRQSGFARQEA